MTQYNIMNAIGNMNVDLELLALLLGRQISDKKCCCFPCERDKRISSSHSAVREWPPHKQFLPARNSIENDQLVRVRSLRKL
jgi:hypothetical protein